MATLYAGKMVMNSIAPLSAPKPSGQVLDFVTKPNSITIVRTSDFNHYIRPPPTPDVTREDFVLTGFIIVNSSKPKRVKRLKVKFVAEARLAYPDRPWEDDVIFENTMWFDGPEDEGIVLDAGPQMFEYAFVLPSTLAGFDRTPFGRISHRILATVVGQPPSTSRFGSFFSSTSRTRSASPGTFYSPSELPTGKCIPSSRDFSPSPMTTSPTTSPVLSPTHLITCPTYVPPRSVTLAGDRAVLSREGSSGNLPSCFFESKPHKQLSCGSKMDDIPWQTGDMIASKEMWIIPLPSENREALPFEFRSRSLVAGLGIIPWALETNAITVGGPLIFQSTLINVNPLATVWCVRLCVSQKFTLSSPRRPEEGDTTLPATQLLIHEKGKLPKNQEEWYISKGTRGQGPVWEGESVPGPASGKKVDGMNIFEALKMPDENRLRPSTCPGTITPIKVSHEFTLQIYFSVWGEDALGKPLPKAGPGKLRKAVLSTNALICSCCCTPSNLALPTYEQSTKSLDPKMDIDCDLCACGQALDELSEREIARDFINEGDMPFGLLDENGNATERGRGRRTGQKSGYSPSLPPN